MDIHAKNNFSKIVIVAAIAFLCCSITGYAVTAEQVLLDSYEKKYSKSNSEECAKIISELESSLNNCNDNYLASRIEYRIGVLRFCAGDYKTAHAIFSKIAEKTSDDDILLSALNMKANSAKFSGNVQDAIASFRQLAEKIAKQESSSEFEKKLIVSSFFSMAQLYNQAGDVSEAIRVYTAFTEKCKNDASMNNYVYKARESIARLLFESGDINGYMTILGGIIDSDIPRGSKGNLELHQVCMDFILTNDKGKCPGSVDEIATYAVALLLSNPKCDTSELLREIAGLSKKYETTKESAYIDYTYACLLDALGDRQNSLKAYEKVVETCSKAGVKEKYYYLGEYAKVQSAILSGELKDYKCAIKMIDSVDKVNTEHLLQISQSVKESLVTLKREEPQNDKIK